MKIVQMRFPNGKTKAFTMSYDDGVIQDRRLVETMNRYGVKGTFHLNSSFLGIKERATIDGFDTDISKIELDEVKQLYEGHEVACHGCTHLKMTDIGSGVVAYQALEDRKVLEKTIEGLCDGFSYPFGSYNDQTIVTLKACGIKYARTVENTGEFNIPEDFMKWHPTCHHNDERLMTLAEKFCNSEGRFGSPMLFYVWGHSYEFEQRNNWDVIEKLISYISQYKEDIYFATNGQICKYVEAFNRLEYSVDGGKVLNPTSTDIYLSLDGKDFCIPAGQAVDLK